MRLRLRFFSSPPPCHAIKYLGLHIGDRNFFYHGECKILQDNKNILFAYVKHQKHTIFFKNFPKYKFSSQGWGYKGPLPSIHPLACILLPHNLWPLPLSGVTSFMCYILPPLLLPSFFHAKNDSLFSIASSLFGN